MAWTEDQKAAIDSRNENLLLAAAAGSGKTAVLTERIIQLLLSEDSGINVDEMLVVTFTKPAAQEMRSRIHDAIITKLLEEPDETIRRKLERQTILLGGASITTFHSFCQSLLRRYFSKINLDPKFRVGEKNELDILRKEIVEKVFEDRYSEDDEAFANFAEKFGGNEHGDDNLHENILKLYDEARSTPDPEGWLENLPAAYNLPENFRLKDTVWGADAFRYIDEILTAALDEINSALKIAVEKNIAKDITTAQESDIPFVEGLKKSAGKGWNELFDALNTDFKRMTSGKIPEELKPSHEKFMDLRKSCKAKIDNLKKFVNDNEEEILKNLRALHKDVKILSEITLKFGEEYTRAKHDRMIIDFDDMQHFALKILKDPSVSSACREKFKTVMVDEYQDTNGVQEEIINRIKGENNLFAVGDVKQSIYRFRYAEPKNFIERYREYASGEGGRKIDLSKNFRSRRQILEAVNSIFEITMTRNAMEIDYDKNARLNFGATYYSEYEDENSLSEPVEFYKIIRPKKDSPKSGAGAENSDDEIPEEESFPAVHDEAQFISNKINELINSGKKVLVKGDFRPVQFRDIVVLIRSKTNVQTFLEVFKENNIPAYATDESGYFKTIEIKIMMSLLSILDNSRQSVPLAAVMLSQIGGFNAEDLARLRLRDGYADLYDLVENDAEENPEGDCAKFLNKIKNWRELSRQVGVPELLSTIYRETGFYDFVGTMTQGVVRKANLRMLADRAADYESTSFRGLSRFIQFIKKMRELDNDLSAARTLGENEDVVRIMTIHKSKGLEFPVVFVAEVGKRFNLRDTSEFILTHKDFGVAPFFVPDDTHARLPTFAREVVSRKILEESRAEELRVLYVALTRAKEKLFLVGSVKESETDKFSDCAELEKIPSYVLQSANGFTDWLSMAESHAQNFIEYKTLLPSEIPAYSGEILAEEKSEEIEIKSAPEKLENSPLATIPAKITVTELKRRAAEFEEGEIVPVKILPEPEKTLLHRRPNFENLKNIDGAQYGTVVHSVMQKLNLRGNLTYSGISAQIKKMVDNELIHPEHAQKIKISDIERFFKSDVGKRLLTSAEIYRELPFGRFIAAKDFFKQAGDEKILVQGIIDLLFVDSSGKRILLDYKTDRNVTADEVRERYKVQINLYARAIEDLLSVKVDEKYLYLLNGGLTVKI